MSKLKFRGLIFSFLVIFVTGCSHSNLNKAFYEGYTAAYSANNSFKVHKILNENKDGIVAKEYASENRGKTPSIILLHGFPDSQHLYDRLVPLLSKRRHVITFDFLGWGESDKPTKHRYDISSLYNDLETVIKHFNLEKVELVAHDLSALPVIDWSLNNENKIQKLILLNSVYFPSKSLISPEAIARFSEDSYSRDVSAWAVNTFDSSWLSGHSDQVEKFFCDKGASNTFLKVLNYQSLEIRNAFLEMNSVLRNEVRKREANIIKMKHFTKPVEIIFGAKDPYLNSKLAKEFHDIYPNSKLHLIENACHYVQMDSPEQVASIILSH
jgi:pimeloyl-ACP methyl ester carboxylesterase